MNATRPKDQVVTVENIKKYLKGFSRFLRRDFLAILVKMCSKELGIRTVREDWRTRSGMFSFLSSAWPKFLVLVSTDTIFRWYCINFESLEKLFSNRKFVMFIYANWSKFREFLSSQETITFLKKNQLEIEQYLEGSSASDAEWKHTEIGEQIIQIINSFKSGISVQATAFVPKREVQAAPVCVPQPAPAAKEEEISFSPQIEDLSSQNIDDIEIQDSYDTLPFDLRLDTSYNDQDYSSNVFTYDLLSL